MNTPYEFEEIEDYLEGRMSASERNAFERALESDAELANQVEALRSEEKVNQLLREEFILEQFAQWEREAKDAPQTVAHPRLMGKIVAYSRWMIPLGIAASLIGIIGVGLIFHWFNGNPDQPAMTSSQPPVKPDMSGSPAPVLPGQEIAIDSLAGITNKKSKSTVRNAALYAALADSAYIDEDFSSALMGADNANQNPSRYTRAVQFYSSGQYSEALKLLENPEQNQLEEFLYLRGYTYYHLKQYARAEVDFRAFRNFPVSDRKIDAQWCEVFCMLKQLPESRKRLDTLLSELKANPDNTYFKRATALRQALERN